MNKPMVLFLIESGMCNMMNRVGTRETGGVKLELLRPFRQGSAEISHFQLEGDYVEVIMFGRENELRLVLEALLEPTMQRLHHHHE
jgi:hypothetical protein